MLADATWQDISWRSGTKGKLKARFAAVRVRVADGPPQRIRDKGQQHLPGDEAWLIGEHRTSGEKKYYLANLPANTDLRTLAATIKARWVCDQAHQQLKEELGLHRRQTKIHCAVRIALSPAPCGGAFSCDGPPMDTFVILFALTVVVAMVCFAAAMFIR